MPNKVVFELAKLYISSIEFSDDMRSPLFSKYRIYKIFIPRRHSSLDPHALLALHTSLTPLTEPSFLSFGVLGLRLLNPGQRVRKFSIFSNITQTTKTTARVSALGRSA